LDICVYDNILEKRVNLNPVQQRVSAAAKKEFDAKIGFKLNFDNRPKGHKTFDRALNIVTDVIQQVTGNTNFNFQNPSFFGNKNNNSVGMSNNQGLGKGKSGIWA